MTAIAHRDATAADQRFIVHSWVSSYRDADTAGFVQVEDWYGVMIPQITKALARPDVRTVVAYEPESGGLYGFIVADVVDRPALVYYVFVKAPYRRGGIARGLFAAAGIDPTKPFNYVCSTPSSHVLQRKIPLARWTPKLGRFPKAERRKAG